MGGKGERILICIFACVILFYDQTSTAQATADCTVSPVYYLQKGLDLNPSPTSQHACHNAVSPDPVAQSLQLDLMRREVYETPWAFPSPMTPPSAPASATLSHPVKVQQQSKLKATGTHSKPSPVQQPVTAESTPKDQAPLFKVSSSAPKGFEESELDVKQTTLVGVYFQLQFVGNAMVVYDSKTIEFRFPKDLVAKINNLKPADKTKVLDALKQALPNHSNLVDATNSNQPYIKALSPKVVGLIFNNNDYRVDLFINPKFILTKAAQTFKLPDSSAGLSFNNNVQMSYSKEGALDTYGLMNQSVWSYKNSQLTVGTNYSYLSVPDQSSQSQLTLSNIYWSHYANQTMWQLGMISTVGDQFLVQQPILGGSIDNHSVSSMGYNSGTASPVVVYLTSPSQVTVYKSNVLIYSLQLGAGKQSIDTRNFPLGAYIITIKTTNKFGQSKTQTQMFVKRADVPSLGHINYHVALGVLQNTVLFGGSSVSNGHTLTVPKFTSTPVLEADTTKSLDYSVSLTNMLLTNFDKVYATAGLDWLSSMGEVKPEMVVSNQNGYGALFNSTLILGQFNLTASAMKMFDDHSTANVIDPLFTTDQFEPLMSNDFRASLGASFAWGANSTSLNGSWDKQNEQSGYSHSYGVTYQRNLFQWHTLTAMFAANYVHMNGDQYLLLGLNFDFFSDNLTGNIALQREDAQSDGDETQDQAVTSGTASLGYQGTWNQSNSINAQADTSYQPGARSYGVSTDVVTNYLLGDANYQRTVQPDLISNQFAANFQTGFMFNDGHIGFGNSNSYSTGVLVDVTAPTSIHYNVLIDDQVVAQGRSGFPIAIYLQPYQAYQIKIEPTGGSLYSYNKNPKKVVLYQGNVETLEWDLAKQILLFTQIVDAKGKPMPDLLYKHQDEFAITDEHGFVQAGVTTIMKHMTLHAPDGESCEVPLPKFDSKEEVQVIKKPLVCILKHAVKGKGHA